ncbi:MAG: radical SAM protein [Lentimicrobium sp.]
MKILLISPSYNGYARGLPLGLAYIAAVLEEFNHEVRVCDIATENISNNELINLLVTFQPEVVGLTSVCANYLNAIENVYFIRNVLGSKVIIIMGGPHPTFSAETILINHDSINFCVIGEADYSFPELINYLEYMKGDLMKINGIAFKKNNKIIFTSPRKKIYELDSLPFPARHLFNISNFPSQISSKVTSSSANTELIVSRGCPYSCEFCSTRKFWGNTYRRHTPQKVLDELLFLISQGFTGFNFNDDIFTADRNWIKDLCNLIIFSGVQIEWSCGTRVDRIDKELLKLMKNAGCKYIYYGVESGNGSIIKTQNKKSTIKQAENAFDLMREVGIYSSSALIFGLPGETLETAKQSVNWIRDIVRPNEIWVSKACCYPGTGLAKHYGVTASDYEIRINGKSKNGLIYGSSGIYTPFFNNKNLVNELWNYIKSELEDKDLLFGDDIENFGISEVKGKKTD